MNDASPCRQSWQRTKHLAKDDPTVRSCLLDDPWGHHRGGDVRGAANHRLLSDHRRDVLRAVDAVLNGQDRGFRAKHRPDEWQRGGIVVGLHRDDHHIDLTDTRGVFFGWSGDGKVTQHRAANDEPSLTNRLEMRPARDERD